MQHSQIVICNYFWRHREQESCARAAAAHHMGLGHSPPAPMAKLCPTARLGPTAGLWADLPMMLRQMVMSGCCRMSCLPVGETAWAVEWLWKGRSGLFFKNTCRKLHP